MLLAFLAISARFLRETGTNSDWHEFVSAALHFFLCVYMRPAGCWTETRNSRTGLSSYRFHVNDNKSQTRSRDFRPVCFWVSDIFIRQNIFSSRNQAPSILSCCMTSFCFPETAIHSVIVRFDLILFILQSTTFNFLKDMS